eukprot:TRINITY_DN2119_c0_g2_i1.p3 TRINITY_DN2119_c0_g2~~TRINITY_DN2119_c0_g2_i1.p3  ORF type:complete len:223 (-),score=-6.43 TRINITY_DN2119_c0_g2_i1:985-1653(-)
MVQEQYMFIYPIKITKNVYLHVNYTFPKINSTIKSIKILKKNCIPDYQFQTRRKSLLNIYRLIIYIQIDIQYNSIFPSIFRLILSNLLQNLIYIKKNPFRCYYQEVVICKHMVLMILHLITLFLPFKFRENERFYGQNSSEKKQKPQFLKNSFYNQLHQFVKFERCVQINGVLTNERSFFNFTFLNQKEKYKFLYLYKVGLIEAAEKCTYLKQQFWGKIYKF